jgi:hypothetical protein
MTFNHALLDQVQELQSAVMVREETRSGEVGGAALELYDLGHDGRERSSREASRASQGWKRRAERAPRVEHRDSCSLVRRRGTDSRRQHAKQKCSGR